MRQPPDETNATRPAVHDGTISFRARSTLIAEAERIADERGMGLSELMRAALRRELRRAA